MSSFILSAFADEIDMNLNTQMSVLKSHSINHIEMRGVNGVNVSELTAQQARDIKARLDDEGFHISAVGSPIGKQDITDDFEPHLELFKRVIETAHILNTKYIRLFSFYIPKDSTEYRDEVFERIDILVQANKGSGVTLLHENERGIYGENAERCVEILSTFKDMRATFDSANFVICGVDALYAFELLREYIAYLHIKDAFINSEVIVPAGQGDGCIPEILSRLKSSGYEGFLSLEPHLADFEGFSALGKGVFVSKGGGGAEKFAVALDALRHILDGI